MPTSAPATSPAPIVVNSSQAENAVNGATQSVANYNATVPVGGNGNTAGTTSGFTQTQYDVNGNPIFNPSASGATTPNTPSSTPSGSNQGNQGGGNNNQSTPAYGAYTDPKTGITQYFAQTGTDAGGNPTYASTPTDTATALNSQIASVQIPQPPSGNEGYNDPYAPGGQVDSSGNIIGTSVPAAIALGSTEDVNDINSRLLATNDQITQSGQDSITMLSNLLNGTIPLSPSQQSLISNMQQQTQNLMELQTEANTSYVGTVTEANAQNGEARYTPANAAAAVNQAIWDGNLKLSTISTNQAIAISQVTEAVQKDDYDAMLSANENYQDTLKQQQTTLENMSSQIQQSIVDARNFNETVQQNTFSNNISSATLSLQQKNYLYQNYISSQNLSLAQKQLAEKTWTDQQSVALQRLQTGISAEQENIAAETFEATFGTGALGTLANGNPSGTGGASGTPQSSGGVTPPALNSDGSAPAAGYKYDATTGQFTDGSGNPITGDALSILKQNLNTAGVHTYDDGLAYLDTSGYSNADMATGAQNAARANGILPLAPADASIVNNLEAAKTQLTNMENYWNQAGAPSNQFMQPISVATRDISALTGGDTSQALSKYQSAQASLYDILSSLSESKRANGGEFEVGQVSLPNMSLFGASSLQSNAKAQFSAMNAQINGLIASIVPGFNAQPNPTNMDATDIANALAGNNAQPTGVSSQPLTGASFFNAASTPTQ